MRHPALLVGEAWCANRCHIYSEPLGLARCALEDWQFSGKQPEQDDPVRDEQGQNALKPKRRFLTIQEADLCRA